LERNEFISKLESVKGIIYKVSNSYCPDIESRKDLAQEIVIQLWQSMDKYDPQYKFSTWVYRIALNMAISFYRKENTRNSRTTSIDETLIDIAFELESKNEQESQLNLLNQFIQQLDKLNKALILLYLDGHNYDEIGNILGISASNVGTKLNRIKKKLKQQFETTTNHGI
jgi:RNA polymerase sigma-70 factor (ECF subfamily)